MCWNGSSAGLDVRPSLYSLPPFYHLLGARPGPIPEAEEQLLWPGTELMNPYSHQVYGLVGN